MKKAIAILCATVFAATTIQVVAQENSDARRTNTWSLYLQGGISWAGGVGMQNVSPSSGTNISGLAGLGIDYNFRPWVRLGLNYEFSKFKREQRFSELQALPPMFNMEGSDTPVLEEQIAGIAYRNTWSHYHNLDLTAEFNVMEIWKNRKAKWLNLYAGIGIGGMFARGNSYDLAMGYEQWGAAESSSNRHEMFSWVKGHNSRHSFNALYIPVVINVEFDVMPRLTLGVKAAYKFLCTSHKFAPDNVGMAAITVRYNFIGIKQGYKSDRRRLQELTTNYDELLDTYRRSQDDCRNRQAAAAAAAAAQQDRLKAIEEENDRLAAENARLKAERDAATATTQPQVEKRLDIQFRFNSDRLTERQRRRLDNWLDKTGPETRFTIVGEANAEGDSRYNQLLSERRLAHVLELLHLRGIGDERIKSATAIGDSAQIKDPTGRRLTITIAE